MSELCKYWRYEMKFDSLNGEVDGECSGVGFVEIYWIFAMQDAYLFRIVSFDREYINSIIASIVSWYIYSKMCSIRVRVDPPLDLTLVSESHMCIST